jgi:peptidoglycan hydrolase CwlO-like protein
MYNEIKNKISTPLIIVILAVLFFVIINFVFTFMGNSKVHYIKNEIKEIKEEVHQIEIENKSLDTKFDNFNNQIKDIDKNIEKNNQAIKNIERDEKTTIDSFRNYTPNEWEKYFADRYK